MRRDTILKRYIICVIITLEMKLKFSIYVNFRKLNSDIS